RYLPGDAFRKLFDADSIENAAAIRGAGLATSKLASTVERGTPKFHFEPPSRFRSLHHLVGTSEERRRDFQGEHLGGLEVNNQLEFGRLLDRQVGRLCAAQNLVNIIGGAPE